MGWGRGGGVIGADFAHLHQSLKSGHHLPENSELSARSLRETFGLLYVGRSIHSVERAVWAAEDGADYLVAGTIYPSNSHPGEPGQGVGFLREVCAAVAPLPVIAIGGITPERVGECIAAGAAGVAVLSPIMRADDPQAVARTYREALDTAWKLRKVAEPMELTINGKSVTLERPLTVREFLDARELNPKMIVVERNGDILRRESFADVTLQAGDILEIVQMMAGG